jgi:hypothetical protein
MSTVDTGDDGDCNKCPTCVKTERKQATKSSTRLAYVVALPSELFSGCFEHPFDIPGCLEGFDHRQHAYLTLTRAKVCVALGRGMGGRWCHAAAIKSKRNGYSVRACKHQVAHTKEESHVVQSCTHLHTPKEGTMSCKAERSRVDQCSRAKLNEAVWTSAAVQS